MRVKVISRSEKEWTRDRSCDLMRRHRNMDPAQHSMAKEIEYQRALTAVKMERMFAKPFLCSLQSHVDSICAIGLDPNQLSHVVSGACDGQIIVWDVARRTQLKSIPNAHRHFVKGIVSTPDSSGFLSCSTDKTVRLWDWDMSVDTTRPVAEYNGNHPFSCVDHFGGANGSNQFVTGSHTLEVWDIGRSQAVQSYQWQHEPIVAAKCNRVETDIVACTTSDRSIVLYDMRMQHAAHSVVLEMKSCCLAWNPMEPASLIVGNDNWNAYLFDVRNFTKAQLVYTSHTASITDIDFSPTGREFVTCSYDRTVRIWEVNGASSTSSRDMYHTQRMHKCWSVKWTLDGQYILSGSEDACLRVWKSNASNPIRPMHPNEKRKLNYRQALKRRYVHLPEIRKIDRQRHVPKYIRTAHRIKNMVLTNQRKKQDRVNRFNPKLAQQWAPKVMREANIVKYQE